MFRYHSSRWHYEADAHFLGRSVHLRRTFTSSRWVYCWASSGRQPAMVSDVQRRYSPVAIRTSLLHTVRYQWLTQFTVEFGINFIRQRLRNFPSVSTPTIAGSQIPFSDNIKTLDVTLDANLTLNQYVSSLILNYLQDSIHTPTCLSSLRSLLFPYEPTRALRSSSQQLAAQCSNCNNWLW